MFNFEKLEVWKKAIDFADLVYKQTQSFPLEERFGLTNQLRRAAVSISSNIAEGSSRSSKTDFARFAEIAAGSVFEVVSQAFIAQRQNFLREDRFRKIYADAEELSRMLSGLRKSLLSTLNPQL
ncbi:MAG: four helix bundle protein [Candidatus Udaeobacter sp.]